MVKKLGVLFLSIILSLTLASALNLTIQKSVISDTIISEFNQPALFTFNITNNGQADYFDVYTLLGVDMTPKGSFFIEAGQTLPIEVGVYLPDNLRKNTGYFTFYYKIRGQNTGIMEDLLRVNVINFQDLFDISAEDIELNALTSKLYIQNKGNVKLEGLRVQANSVFFDFSSNNITILPNEKLELNMALNPDKTKNLIAGTYLMTSEISKDNFRADYESYVKFVEQKEVSGSEKAGGFLITEKLIEKRNSGNVISVEEATVRKNVISRLFTTFSITPDKVDRRGLLIYYSWQQELKPGESFVVKVRTNWTLPFLIVVFIIVVALAVKLYTRKDADIIKKVVFVKTKGGEFALKVILSVKSKKFIENVKLVDKIPSLVRMHEKYTTLSPDKFDERNKRAEWNLGNLNAGEYRVFSYVVYSNINIVGRFVLPPATMVYEREGKIIEIESNEVVFLNEIRRRTDL